jgi:hypothetical protein
MKKIFYTIIAIIMIAALGVLPTFATDTETVTPETEAVETVTEALEIDSEAASEIVDIIEASGTKAEAIVALAEKMGISIEDAEKLVDSMIEVGDKYLGDTKWWVGFKSTVESDMQFWIVVALIALVVLALLSYSLTMHIKFSSPMKRLDYSMNSEHGLANTVKASCDENSQALGKMMELYKAALENKAIYEKELLDKDGEILRCNEQIVQLKEARIKESKDMLIAAACNLRMLKLVIDRTAMPITDKATIDLFYANGMKAIEAELSEEDFAKLEKRLAMLDSVGGQQNE